MHQIQTQTGIIPVGDLFAVRLAKDILLEQLALLSCHVFEQFEKSRLENEPSGVRYVILNEAELKNWKEKQANQIYDVYYSCFPFLYRVSLSSSVGLYDPHQMRIKLGNTFPPPKHRELIIPKVIISTISFQFLIKELTTNCYFPS